LPIGKLLAAGATVPTSLLFDSSQFAEADAEEIWRSSLGSMYDIQRPKEQAFRARLEAFDLGPFLLTKNAASDVEFHRTRRLIAQSGVDHYLAHCLVNGTLASTFSKGSQRVPLGSVAIRDMAAETVGHATGAQMITLTIPREALDRRMPHNLRLHGACLESGNPLGALVATHIQTLATLAPAMTADQTRVAAEATLDLLAACLGPAAATLGREDSRLAPALRGQALSYIEQHLDDPGLSPDQVCLALKVSRSALYEMFEPLGGIANRIRSRRLDESMRRLTAPMHAHERIAEIAYGMGFSSESVFTRSFRERFGCTPSEARKSGVQSMLRQSVAAADGFAGIYDNKVRNLKL
jgi:AraC-like DNA-binding protein